MRGGQGVVEEVKTNKALEIFKTYDFETCLDIGSGGPSIVEGALTCDLSFNADFKGDYLSFEFKKPFDAIWASHVLEHQRNPGLFLEKIRKDVKVGGVVAIIVPPYREKMVGGHIHLGNGFHLVYNMILAGFDCSKARVNTYGYNIAVIVERKDAELPPLLMDKGDLEVLQKFFPFPVPQGVDYQGGAVNW